MKVYLVMETDLECEEVRAVCSTKELADKYIFDTGERSGWFRVVEWAVANDGQCIHSDECQCI